MLCERPGTTPGSRVPSLQALPLLSPITGEARPGPGAAAAPGETCRSLGLRCSVRRAPRCGSAAGAGCGRGARARGREHSARCTLSLSFPPAEADGPAEDGFRTPDASLQAAASQLQGQCAAAPQRGRGSASLSAQISSPPAHRDTSACAPWAPSAAAGPRGPGGKGSAPSPQPRSRHSTFASLRPTEP